MRSRHLPPSKLLMLAGMLVSTPVASQDYVVYVDRVAMASGVCKPSTAAYKPQVRQQPLGIYNIGATNAFVTCSAQQIQYGTNADIVLRLHNRGTQAQSITCTVARSSTYLIPRTVTVAANARRQMQLYSGYGDPVDFNCNLPPETGILSVRTNGRAD